MERENNARIELLNKRIDTLIGDLADLRSFSSGRFLQYIGFRTKKKTGWIRF